MSSGWLVVASAALYALAFPPFSLSPVAWLCLVPLIVALSRMTPLRAGIMAVAWASLTTLAVTWWLPGAIERYFEMPWLPAWLGFGLIAVGVNGLPYAPFGAFVAWQSRRGREAPIAVAAAFCLAEFMRANGPIAQPFALIGYSQYETAFAQLSSLLGPFGVGALIVGANATMALFFQPRLEPGRARRESWVIAAFIVVAFVYGETRLRDRIVEDEAVRVAVVQPALVPNTREARLASALRLTRQAAAANPELIFWPEYAVDFYLREPGEARDRLLATARESGADLVLGAPHYLYARSAISSSYTGPVPASSDDPSSDSARTPRFEQGRARYFSSVFLIREGEIHDRYDKMRLVPFAESSPRIAGFSLPVRGDVHYEAGGRARLLESRRLRIGAFLCVEALFPDVARELTREGAEVLANPSNDEWFAHPAAASHQLAVASFRAIENARYLVRSAPGGLSSVIDSRGRVVDASSFGEEALLLSEVRASTEVTLYQTAGNIVVWVAALYLVAGGLVAVRVPSWER